MKSILHKANTRGHANHGWLDSYHSFSFAGYYDPERVHFGALRVLNDDTVAGGRGFGAHPHDNMEIISIPTEGALEHKDNMGNTQVIGQGDVQVMSAGTGIQHAEKNKSVDAQVKFFQIWVFPKEKDITPRYDQKVFDAEDKSNKIVTVVSPDKKNGVLWINQDSYFSLTSLDADKSVTYKINHKGNGVYIFIIDGEVEIAGEKLSKRDAMGLEEIESVEIKALQNSEVLFIEVPMN